LNELAREQMTKAPFYRAAHTTNRDKVGRLLFCRSISVYILLQTTQTCPYPDCLI